MTVATRAVYGSRIVRAARWGRYRAQRQEWAARAAFTRARPAGDPYRGPSALRDAQDAAWERRYRWDLIEARAVVAAGHLHDARTALGRVPWVQVAAWTVLVGMLAALGAGVVAGAGS